MTREHGFLVVGIRDGSQEKRGLGELERDVDKGEAD